MNRKRSILLAERECEAIADRSLTALPGPALSAGAGGRLP